MTAFLVFMAVMIGVPYLAIWFKRSLEENDQKQYKPSFLDRIFTSAFKPVVDDIFGIPPQEPELIVSPPSYRINGNGDRPDTLDDFIGNSRACESIKVILSAAEIAGHPVPNILLVGNAGTGKTTLARIIAKQLDARFMEMSGSSIKSQMDFIKILHVINDYQCRGEKVVLFIDEIHGIIKGKDLSVDNWLPFFEEYYFYHSLCGKKFDHIALNGRIQRKMMISNKSGINPIPIIGATTYPGMLDDAIRRRFRLNIYLEDYTENEIGQVILKYCDRNHVSIDDQAVMYLADRSRLTPGIALNMLKTAKDVMIYKHVDRITGDVAYKASEMLGIYIKGLRMDDWKVLMALQEQSKGMGVSNLSGKTGVSKDNLEAIVCPYLQKLGFVAITSRRVITEKGVKFLNENRYLLNLS